MGFRGTIYMPDRKPSGLAVVKRLMLSLFPSSAASSKTLATLENENFQPSHVVAMNRLALRSMSAWLSAVLLLIPFCSSKLILSASSGMKLIYLGT